MVNYVHSSWEGWKVIMQTSIVSGESQVGSYSLESSGKASWRWLGKEPHLYDFLEFPTCSSVLNLSYSLELPCESGIIIFILQARKWRFKGLSVYLSHAAGKGQCQDSKLNPRGFSLHCWLRLPA